MLQKLPRVGRYLSHVLVDFQYIRTFYCDIMQKNIAEQTLAKFTALNEKLQDSHDQQGATLPTSNTAQITRKERKGPQGVGQKSGKAGPSF